MPIVCIRVCNNWRKSRKCVYTEQPAHCGYCLMGALSVNKSGPDFAMALLNHYLWSQLNYLQSKHIMFQGRKTVSPSLGTSAEVQAEKFLAQQGLRTHARNYRCRLGEIDLIMQDAD